MEDGAGCARVGQSLSIRPALVALAPIPLEGG